MFYLTTHSTHFIYGYMASDIWLRTILIVRKETRCRHIGYSYLTDRIIHTTAFVTPVVEHGYMASDMVKDHSDSEKGNLLPPHFIYGYSYRLTASAPRFIQFFYQHHPTDRMTHTTAFVIPVVEHWLEREIAQWVHPMKDRSDDPSHHERTLYL